MMDLKKADLSDVALIERLGKTSYQEHFGHLWSIRGLENYLNSHFSEQALIAQLKTPYIRYYIPYYNQSPAGILKVKFHREIPAPPMDFGLELEKIYLLDEFTGKGIGNFIMENAKGIAAQNGESFLWLDVLKTNHRARKMYETQGFEIVNEIKFSTDIQEIGMWIMRLNL